MLGRTPTSFAALSSAFVGRPLARSRPASNSFTTGSSSGLDLPYHAIGLRKFAASASAPRWRCCQATRARSRGSVGVDLGLAVAMIDLADVDTDDGMLDEAFALYDKALAKAKDHPLAVLGKSLARAENSVQANDAIEG